MSTIPVPSMLTRPERRIPSSSDRHDLCGCRSLSPPSRSLHAASVPHGNCRRNGLDRVPTQRGISVQLTGSNWSLRTRSAGRANRFLRWDRIGWITGECPCWRARRTGAASGMTGPVSRRCSGRSRTGERQGGLDASGPRWTSWDLIDKLPGADDADLQATDATRTGNEFRGKGIENPQVSGTHQQNNGYPVKPLTLPGH
jgi:hypothetical protein